MVYFWASLGLMFLAVFLAIWAGGEWIANRLAAERGVYERILGKELHRLFMDISPQEFVLIHLFIFAAGIGLGIVMMEDIFGGLIGGLVGLMGPRLY
ncbi:MAG: hypothetical protein ACNA8W_17545, partial [Bradymonadaceae bacterium]